MIVITEWLNYMNFQDQQKSLYSKEWSQGQVTPGSW